MPKCFPISLGSLKFHSETLDWDSQGKCFLTRLLECLLLASHFLHVSTHLCALWQFWEILVGFNILIFCIFSCFFLQLAFWVHQGLVQRGRAGGLPAHCLQSRRCPGSAWSTQFPWEDRFGGPQTLRSLDFYPPPPLGPPHSHPSRAEELPACSCCTGAVWTRRLLLPRQSEPRAPVHPPACILLPAASGHKARNPCLSPFPFKCLYHYCNYFTMCRNSLRIWVEVDVYRRDLCLRQFSSWR